MTNKTRIAYGKQLQMLDEHVARLGEHVVSHIVSCGIALVESDKGAAQGVLEGHDATERLRHLVEESCMSMMLLQQPMARDMRFVTAAFRSVSNLARIDEMCVDIAEMVLEVPSEKLSPLVDSMHAMSKRVADMVTRAVSAFTDSDAAGAEMVYPLDDEVDALFVEIRDTIVEDVRSNDSDLEWVPELFMIAKYFERMGDHAEHFADWAVFRATGEKRGHLMGDVDF